MFGRIFSSYSMSSWFTGDILCYTEGTIAFPGEALLRFHGTTMEAWRL